MRDRILANTFTIYQHPEVASKQSDWEKDGLNGQIKHVKIESARFYEDSGEYKLNNPILISAHSYNDKGKKTEEFFYNNDGSLSYKGIFLYDSQGRLIESTEDNVEILFSKCIYQYDEKGLPKDSFEYDKEGELISRWVHHYDQEGQIQESFRYRESSALWRWVKYSNQEDNSQIEETNYGPDGAVSSREVCTYNPQGKLIHKAKHIFGTSSQQTEHYIYDKQGNMIEAVCEYADGFRDSRMYSYDEKGNMTESTWYQSDGTMVIKLNFQYKYGDNGNWTEMSVFESIMKERQSMTPPVKTLNFPMETQYRNLIYY